MTTIYKWTCTCSYLWPQLQEFVALHGQRIFTYRGAHIESYMYCVVIVIHSCWYVAGKTTTQHDTIWQHCIGYVTRMPLSLQINDDLTAKLDLSTYRFLFMDSHVITHPQWYGPEGQALNWLLKFVHPCILLNTPHSPPALSRGHWQISSKHVQLCYNPLGDGLQEDSIWGHTSHVCWDHGQ